MIWFEGEYEASNIVVELIEKFKKLDLGDTIDVVFGRGRR
jgi:hypothetical protein